MKHALTSLVVVSGFCAGWLLPPLRPQTSPPPRPAAAPASKLAEHARHARTRQLLALLLDEPERAAFRRKSARSLAGLLGVIRHSGQFSQPDVERIVAMDPATALEQLLSAPGASTQLGESIALEWASRDPDGAIGFLLEKPSYRGEDFLCQALIGACGSNPQLVAETIRKQSRRWQERNLETLFASKISIPTAAEPATPSGESDTDNSTFRSAWFGEDILNCLADEPLRDKARACWNNNPPLRPITAKAEPVAALELAELSAQDYGAASRLRELLRSHPDETLAAVAEKGSYQARATLMMQSIQDFPIAQEAWPEGFKRLEDLMAKLEVIPIHQPGHPETGPFLQGSAAADWIASQPLALQRAWSPAFTETWAQSEPALAINWARELPPGAAGNEATQRGLIVWAHAKPLEAAAYVADLPPGDLRDAAISNTAAAWAGVDRAGAAAWLAQLPDSPAKARAIERVK